MASGRFSSLMAATVSAVCLGVAGSLWIWNHSPVPAAASQESEEIRWIGTVADPEWKEISGIALSHLDPNRCWIHNDSGDQPRIACLNLDGKSVAVCAVPGAEHRDWEDCASFLWQDKPWLLIADVGDNGRVREECQLYLFPEPEVAQGAALPLRMNTAEPVVVRFRYEDGPRNCEAAGIDPTAGKVWLVEKAEPRRGEPVAAGVYCLDLAPWMQVAPEPAAAKTEEPETVVLPRIASLPFRAITAMDLSRDGKRWVLRSYFSAAFADLPAGQTWQDHLPAAEWIQLPIPVEVQGEAIAWEANGESVLLTSERARQPIWSVRIPQSGRSKTESGGKPGSAPETPLQIPRGSAGSGGS